MNTTHCMNVVLGRPETYHAEGLAKLTKYDLLLILVRHNRAYRKDVGGVPRFATRYYEELREIAEGRMRAHDSDWRKWYPIKPTKPQLIARVLEVSEA